MKKITILFLFVFVCLTVFSQVPKKINYQAIARDSNGKLLNAKTIDVKFEIFDAFTGGNLLFSEKHIGKTTDARGLFTAEIGGAPGSSLNISWNGNRYLEITISDAGTDYILSPRNYLISVPYALYADSAKYVSQAAAGWSLMGNSGTTPGVASGNNFVGTTDSRDLVFGTDSKERIRIKRDSMHVAIGNPPVFSSINSILEITSKSKGVLIPRMTTAQMNAILPSVTADDGLLIYNTSDTLFYYWDRIKWRPINAGTSNIWVKNGAYIRTSNPLIDYVGIGTTTIPVNTKLEVVGKTKLHDSTLVTGYTTSIINNNTFSTGQSSGALEIINDGSRTINNNAVLIQNNSTKPNVGSNTTKTGIKVESTGSWSLLGPNSEENQGIYVKADGAPTNYAIRAEVSHNKPATTTTPINYGIYSSVRGTGATNWAGYFDEGNLYIKQKIKIGGMATFTPGGSDFEHDVNGNSFGYVLKNNTNNSLGTFVGANPTNSLETGAGIGTISQDNFHIFTNNGSNISSRMVVKPNGNVGIATTTPSEKLEVNGNSQISGEYKYASPKIHYYSIDPTDFVQTATSLNVELQYPSDGSSIYFTNSIGIGWIAAPIHLPDDAIIEEVQLVCTDNYASGDLTLYLYEGGTQLNSISTSGSSPGPTTILLNVSKIVNNSSQNYRVLVRFPIKNQGPSVLSVSRVSIKYSVGKAN